MNRLLSQIRWLTIVLAANWLAIGSARAAEPDLPAKAYALLKKHCHDCHGVDYVVTGLDVLNRSVLIADQGAGRTPYLSPGDPEKSRIWQQIQDGRMPKTDVKLTSAEQQIIREWIAAGAVFPAQAGPRPLISEVKMLTDIRDHLLKIPAADRSFQRFLTLTHLWNNGSVTERDLRVFRAALAKLVNSLSLAPQLIPLTAVDQQQTVFCLDLRQAGLVGVDRWLTVISKYPYALKPLNLQAGQLQDEILKHAGRGALSVAHVRGDWFVATASQAPRYDALLRLPKTRQELEKSLEIDADQNLLSDRVRRAGFNESGISSQPRVVERHLPAEGRPDPMYWISYDFFPGGDRSNPMRFPLGPDTATNPHSQHAFRHGGGEIIYRLKNGLHAYMLVDKDGLRISKAPIEVVWFRGAPALGSPVIVNGQSCMECHRNGMKSFVDVVRDGVKLFDLEAQNKVASLYTSRAEMDKIVADDEHAYLETLGQVIGPWLQQGEDAGRDISDFPEPISALARRYQQDLSLEDVAAELWCDSSQKMQTIIRGNSQLQSLGLGTLAIPAANGGSPPRIKRAVLESLEGAESTFQAASFAMGDGLPVIVP